MTDESTSTRKRPYIAPTITVLSFKAEKGYALSYGIATSILPDSDGTEFFLFEQDDFREAGQASTFDVDHSWGDSDGWF